MTKSKKLGYHLIPANDEIFDEFLHRALVQVGKDTGFTVPGFSVMSMSHFLKYPMYQDPKKGMALIDYMRDTMTDPLSMNFFVKDRLDKHILAYISLGRIAQRPFSPLTRIRTLPIAQRGTQIYGKILQDILHEIFSSFIVGSWSTHIKDPAAADYRVVAADLQGVSIDICDGSHFHFDRNSIIYGVAAYNPCAQSGNNIIMKPIDEGGIECMEEAVRFL